jgi:hypothetical protein
MQTNRLLSGLGVAALLCQAALLIFSDDLKAGKNATASSWGFSLGNLDTTCKPCDDFHEFAMGRLDEGEPDPGRIFHLGHVHAASRQ